MPTSLKIGDYIDSASGIVTNPLDDPFGDSVWRSSWFYASLLTICGLDRPTYVQIATDHGLDIGSAATFLNYFLKNGTGDSGWLVPGSSQKFSTDQLAPLLYLLEAASSFGDASSKTAASAILDSLLELERTGTPLSDSHSGEIHSNLGYVIDVLCDAERYDKTYRTQDLPLFLTPCLGNIDCARTARRAAYKQAFGLALSAQNIGTMLGQDEFSFFNAIALVALQALAWGTDDQDVAGWRKPFVNMADKGGGPAFTIVSGQTIDANAIDDLKTATTCTDVDNDIVMSQRPSKFIDGTFPHPSCTASPKTIALDYVIVKALSLALSGGAVGRHIDTWTIPHVDSPAGAHVDGFLIPHNDIAAGPHGDGYTVPHVDTTGPHVDTIHADGHPFHTDAGVDHGSGPFHVDGHTDAPGPHVDTPHGDGPVPPHVDTPSSGHVDAPVPPHADTPSQHHNDAPVPPHVDTPPQAHVDAPSPLPI